MLAPRIAERVRHTIEFHDLHRVVPVDIRTFAEDAGWRISYAHGMEELYAISIVCGEVQSMAISHDIAIPLQRQAIAHEWAHLLAEHDDGVQTMRRRPLWHSKQEREADIIAASLLIPDWVLLELETVAEVAAACDVPPALVDMRIRT